MEKNQQPTTSGFSTSQLPECRKRSWPLCLHDFSKLFNKLELTQRSHQLFCITTILLLAGITSPACTTSASLHSAPDQDRTQKTVLDPQKSQETLEREEREELEAEIDERRERAVLLIGEITKENPNLLSAIDCAENSGVELPDSHSILIIRGGEVIAAIDYQFVAGEGWLDEAFFSRLQVGDEIWLLQKGKACGGRSCIDALLEDFQKDPRPDQQKSLANMLRIEVETERFTEEGNGINSYVVYELKSGKNRNKKLILFRTGHLRSGGRGESWAHGVLPVEAEGLLMRKEAWDELLKFNNVEESSLDGVKQAIKNFLGQ